MDYILMRKNEPIGVMQFNDTNNTLEKCRNIQNEDLAPLENKNDSKWINKWWKNRSIPISQGKIQKMLERNGIPDTEDYMIENLGLSLTDYYWIKPVDSTLTWEDVNLFDNDFSENLFVKNTVLGSSIPAYAPNSTLQGQLEKTWSIDENGDRILIKGNRDYLSSESINEVIAGEIHRRQGYKNYVPYHLLHIKDRDYDYGCCSKLFTDQNNELVSAYAVLTSEKKPNNKNTYEQFIDVCGKHGINTDELRHDLEYQIMTDFVMSNVDRHLTNVSILRDADTLQFKQMAPIYDTGRSLFVGKRIPTDNKELFRTEVSSFTNRELKLLDYVQDKSIVNINCLPNGEYIRSMYEKDSQVDEHRMSRIIDLYERKVDLLDEFQHGKNISPYYGNNKDRVFIHNDRVKQAEICSEKVYSKKNSKLPEEEK